MGVIGPNYVYRDALGNGSDLLVDKNTADNEPDTQEYLNSQITAYIWNTPALVIPA